MDEYLKTIVERSSTLWERSSPMFVSTTTDGDQETIDFRMKKWREASAKGDPELFEICLKLDDLDVAMARQFVGPVRLADGQSLPSWAAITLKEIIESARYLPSASSAEKIPLQEVLVPIVSTASIRLKGRFSRHEDLLASGAFTVLERSLLLSLSNAFSRPAVLELHIARMLNQLKGDTAEERYEDFLKNRIGNPQGMLSFFLEYPVLARLTANLVESWVESNARFLLHLRSDFDEIQNVFANGKHPGKVIEIVDGLSDPHAGRQTVKALSFTCGMRLIYKPKNLGIDIAFTEVLSWLNQQHNLLPFKTFQILDKGSHGWTEFVDALPCHQEEEVKRYYRRSGQLLALLYVL